jgi:glyoxylase-like metal-dependent hydrolase (beta-lactamase superfamily II)
VPPTTDPVLQPVGAGAWLLPGRFPRGRQPDGNSLVLEGRDGLVVIDTGRHAEHTQALLDFSARRGRPIASVINTHWHLDHLGGNARLREALPALEVIGSPAVERAIDQRFAGFRRDMEALLADPATEERIRAMVRIDLALYDRAAAMRPTRSIEGPPQALPVAGRELTIGHEAAASDGDLWVLDRASGVLAVGDLVTLPVPFLDTACPARWREALARVDALAFERLLPGHGPVMDRAQWRRWRSGFEALLDCAASDAPPRTCSARWVDDMGPLLGPQEHAGAHSMLAHYFAQRLRATDRDRFCAPG